MIEAFLASALGIAGFVVIIAAIFEAKRPETSEPITTIFNFTDYKRRARLEPSATDKDDRK